MGLRIKEDLGLKLVNVITYIVFLSSNAYASLVPSDSRWGAGAHDTYVTPASWLFGVWGLIHFLLLGLVVIQFFDAGHEPVVSHVGWRFPILALLTSAYAGLNSASTYHYSHGEGSTSRIYAILAFIALLLSAGVVSHVYRDLKVRHAPNNWADLAFVHVPFSLYHGFVVVLLVVSGFSAFGVNANHHKAGVFTSILVFIALLFLEATAAGYVFYGHGDIAGAVVICASLLAIFQQQTSNAFIHWSAFAFFLISLIAVLRATIAAFRGGRNAGRIALDDEERAPLVR